MFKIKYIQPTSSLDSISGDCILLMDISPTHPDVWYYIKFHRRRALVPRPTQFHLQRHGPINKWPPINPLHIFGRSLNGTVQLAISKLLFGLHSSWIYPHFRLEMPQSGSELRFGPELFRTWPKSGSKFGLRGEPDLWSGPRFEDKRVSLNLFELVRTCSNQCKYLHLLLV